MKTFMAFLEEKKDKIFRFLEYNKFNIWTPGQHHKMYCDESVYICNHYDFAKITNAWDTPNGLLLELDLIDGDDFTSYNHKVYKLLTGICLEEFDMDNDRDKDDAIQ